MIRSTRLLIPALLLSHLLLLRPGLISQVSPAASSRREPVTMKATENQEKIGSLYKLRGSVEIHYRSFILYADEATYDDDTGEATAEGHVVLDGGPNDEHIRASHGTYNVETEKGRFYDVVGTIGLRQRAHAYVLTSSDPFAFTGKVVDKTGPDHYVVHDGTITTCELPHPKWQFNAHRVVVKVGGNALIYRSTFRVLGVPILYFPFATHPAEHLQRQSGFLMPHFGLSSRKGTIFGDSFYWAINRSMDATIGGEYFSQRGSAQYGQFRIRPGQRSFVDVNYFGVLDRLHQGGQDVRATGEDRFGDNSRLVGDVDYLSSFISRLIFNEVFTQAVYSEVQSRAFFSHPRDGRFFNAEIERYQNFESAAPGDVVTFLHAPSLEVASVDHQLGHSPLYWSYDTAGEGLSRSDPATRGPLGAEPAFRTAPLVGRFDFHPALALPWQVGSWSFRPELGVEETLYTQRLVENGTARLAKSSLLNRHAVEASFQLRPPSLERVFARPLWGHRLKHVLEPIVQYRRVAGVDNFSQILRFDFRDILSNTNEVEYGVIHRLYIKKLPAAPSATPRPEATRASSARERTADGEATRPGASSEKAVESTAPSRELISWEIAQKYFLDPSFGGALVNGQRNVFNTTTDFSAISFLTSPRRLSPIISRLRFVSSAHLEGGWDLDYDFKISKINASTTLLNFTFGQTRFGVADFLGAPGIFSGNLASAARFHQTRAQVFYGSANKRGFTGGATVGFDERTRIMQYAVAQSTYNWDCCGITFEYRRFALGRLRNENEYRFSFSLANVGTFGTLRRLERIY